MNEGLITSLNQIREISSEIYHQYIPILDENSDISKLAQPVLSVPEVYNDFVNALVNRIVYTQFLSKSFTNPFKVLEGEGLPLGYAGQEVYTNPAMGRQYNPNDFAGLLVKYEADVKVQYTTINYDVQYPVTFSREQLKRAFVSWDTLTTFINDLSNSLYNGAYIGEYNAVKQLIAGAYKDNLAIIETVTAVTSEATGLAFTEKARELFLQFQTPTDKFNAWHKADGDGRPVMTWTRPEDVVFVLRNDIRAKLDVNVLANAFNIEKATLMGNIIGINDFDIYDNGGTKIFDGSKVLGIIADKAWFRIKTADMFMDSFYNPNNRSIQYYLNDIKMFNVSLFANGVILATADPEDVPYKSLSFGTGLVEVEEGETEGLDLTALPTRANEELTYASSNELIFTVAKSATDERHCTVTAVDEGQATLSVTSASGVTGEVTIKVTAAE